MSEIGDQGAVSALLDRRSDGELARLMGNLGGHDMPSLLEAFAQARTHDRPVCFICYTIKGFGLPLAGHKDNHAGLMNPVQVAGLQAAMGVRAGHEWERFEGLPTPAAELEAFLAAVPFNARGTRRFQGAAVPVPDTLPGAAHARDVHPARLRPADARAGEGRHRTRAARGDHLAGRDGFDQPRCLGEPPRPVRQADRWPTCSAPSASPPPSIGASRPKANIFELGIAEMNLFTMLSALGLSHSIDGERLLPVGTLYDPFIERGLDALNYACYQDARFILVATPSGISLAGEGGAHQSIATPLIGMAQDGLVSFEPAYVDELAVLLRWAFDYMQRDGKGADGGGSVYFRLSTRTIAQPQRALAPAQAGDMIAGGYWVRKTRPECPGGDRLRRGGGARGGRGRRPDRRGSARCRPARGDLGGPAARGLGRDEGRTRRKPCRPPARGHPARVRAGDGARRPPRRARLARRGAWAPDAGRWASRDSDRPGPFRTSTVRPGSTRSRSPRRRRRWRPDARSGICAPCRRPPRLPGA